MYSQPLAYFITFRTRGSWFHGDDRGSVDRRHNTFGTPMLPRNPALAAWERAQMRAPSRELTTAQRAAVEAAIREACVHRGWELLEVNARTNHVHVIVTAGGPPEPFMNSLKSWSTTGLVKRGLIKQGEKPWSRGGSTIYIFKPEILEEKRKYVRDGQ